MADEVKFCYKCGASLPEGADFCPECGSSVRIDSDGTRPEPTVRSTPNTRNDLGAIPILILLYGIFALVMALMAIISGAFFDTMLETLKSYVKSGLISQQDYDQIIEMLGATSEAAIEAIKIRLIVEGLVFALSGVAALVSSRFCGKLENYKMAFTLCIVASALTIALVFLGDIFGLLLAIVGFIICYLIYQNKYKFTS